MLRIIVLEPPPLTPYEHIMLGFAYESKGLLDDAIKQYEAAAKKNPDALLYLGNAYFLKGELDKAESCYKKSIRERPENSDAYNNLAWIYYLRKENLKEAKYLVKKALELNPDKRDIYFDTLLKIEEIE
ncbi:MAG: tetratricopeptide repeat protein [Thermodesulfovibrionales bacterium]|nr:tetratricopeptide repeat protein [Thermodesulfovibrionales bacterium]